MRKGPTRKLNSEKESVLRVNSKSRSTSWRIKHSLKSSNFRRSLRSQNIKRRLSKKKSRRTTGRNRYKKRQNRRKKIIELTQQNIGKIWMKCLNLRQTARNLRRKMLNCKLSWIIFIKIISLNEKQYAQFNEDAHIFVFRSIFF